jgi:hypothetical protein
MPSSQQRASRSSRGDDRHYRGRPVKKEGAVTLVPFDGEDVKTGIEFVVRAAVKDVERICFPDRREAIARRNPASRKPGVTNPWLPVERMRSTRGGSGPNLLFRTVRKTNIAPLLV